MATGGSAKGLCTSTICFWSASYPSRGDPSSRRYGLRPPRCHLSMLTKPEIEREDIVHTPLCRKGVNPHVFGTSRLCASLLFFCLGLNVLAAVSYNFRKYWNPKNRKALPTNLMVLWNPSIALNLTPQAHGYMVSGKQHVGLAFFPVCNLADSKYQCTATVRVTYGDR